MIQHVFCFNVHRDKSYNLASARFGLKKSWSQTWNLEWDRGLPLVRTGQSTDIQRTKDTLMSRLELDVTGPDWYQAMSTSLSFLLVYPSQEGGTRLLHLFPRFLPCWKVLDSFSSTWRDWIHVLARRDISVYFGHNLASTETRVQPFKYVPFCLKISPTRIHTPQKNRIR